jgi:hypothetical protein
VIPPLLHPGIRRELSHVRDGLPLLEQAFLTQRLKKLPFQDGCRDSGRGNSIVQCRYKHRDGCGSRSSQPPRAATTACQEPKDVQCG